MSLNSPTLHMLCGKIASGKSTLAAKLAAPDHTVHLSEDTWLAALFADQMRTGPDYVRCAAKLLGIMGPHVTALLQAGVSVVLDFPANTVETRAWMRDIVANSAAVHQMHVVDVPDDVCLARLRARNAQGDHAFAATEGQFHRFARYFQPPSPEEGFTIVMHDAEG